MPQVEQSCDVHCVTKWTMLDAHWTGVRIADLAQRAKLKSNVRHVDLRGGRGLHLERAPARGARPDVAPRASPRGSSRSPSRTAPRCARSCRTSTSGRARSGSPGSGSSRWTNRDIGRSVATTITPTPGKRSAIRSRVQWRALLRALHRDFGYTAVGLTVVYALSGLAVNHIGDWDPSFENYTAQHELGPLGSADDDAIAKLAARATRDQGEAERRVPHVADGARRDLRSPHAPRESGDGAHRRGGAEAAVLPARGELAAPQSREESVALRGGHVRRRAAASSRRAGCS